MTPIEPRWYCVNVHNGGGVPCNDKSDAEKTAARYDCLWPSQSPHRAVLLGDIAAERETSQRLREAIKVLIDCHDEPDCPAVSLARDALKT